MNRKEILQLRELHHAYKKHDGKPVATIYGAGNQRAYLYVCACGAVGYGRIFRVGDEPLVGAEDYVSARGINEAWRAGFMSAVAGNKLAAEYWRGLFALSCPDKGDDNWFEAMQSNYDAERKYGIAPAAKEFRLAMACIEDIGPKYWFE
jgi:hypothetical protein